MQPLDVAILRTLANEPYEARGILHSEIALILYVCERLQIECIIESGRARAQSTYLLAKYLPDIELHSVELYEGPDELYGRERVADLVNVTLHYGDGTKIVPWLAAQSAKPTAILCDGPKGAKAVAILEQCFVYPQISVGFIHDMRRLDHGQPSPHRAAALARLPKHRFSDDPRWIAATSWMDAGIAEAGGPCGPQHEAQFGSYGPTLGAFFNPIAISNKQGIRP